MLMFSAYTVKGTLAQVETLSTCIPEELASNLGQHTKHVG
jgi:hypothetical protein